MSLFSSSKCVLFLNDEGVAIYDAAPGRVELVESVPWVTQDFEESVSEIIRKKLGGRKILILNDMVEQHYRKERVPRVGALDKANILKRRVAAAFPTHPIRAFLKLKEKPAKDADIAPGDIYLFAAVPQSENMRKVIDAVSMTNNSISGFGLLPVESSTLVQELSKRTGKSGSAAWTIFVGQHKNGGLRQIVTRNGELALTRMTLMTESLSDSESWSNGVVSELRGTMSYLSRFGFDPRDGLHVIVISDGDVTEKISAKVDFECSLNVLTLEEAAGLLKLRLGRNQDRAYADPLHVAWASRKPAIAMPLKVTELDKIAAPARAAALAISVMAVAAAYAGYMAYSQNTLLAKETRRLQQQKAQIVSVQAEHDMEVEKKKQIGVDFMLIEKAGSYYERLDAANMVPLPVLDKIARALGPDLHLTSLEIRPASVDQTASSTPAAEPQYDATGNLIPTVEVIKNKPFDVVVGFSFPPTLPVEEGVKQVNDFQQRISANLPSHKVSVIKQVADLSYTGNFVSEGNSPTAADVQQKPNYEAQILVSGELR